MKSILISTLIFLNFHAVLAQQQYPFSVDISGKGQAIILIPGLASSGAVWDETVGQLEKSFECHVLTLAGFAGETPIAGADSLYLPRIKQGIIDYIKDRELKSPILMGHSLGGFISLWIAAEKPTIPSKILIVDAYPFYSAMNNIQMTVDQVTPQAAMMKKMIVSTTDDMFEMQQKQTLPTLMKDSSKIEQAIQWSVESDRATIAQAMYEIMTTDLRGEVKNVDCPILVLGSWYLRKNFGVTSQMVFDNFRQQFADAKELTIKIAPTAYHFIMYDEFDWFMEWINKFLR